MQLNKSEHGWVTDDHPAVLFYSITIGPFKLPGGDTQHCEHKLKVVFFYTPFQDKKEKSFEIVEAKVSNIKLVNDKS